MEVTAGAHQPLMRDQAEGPSNPRYQDTSQGARSYAYCPFMRAGRGSDLEALALDWDAKPLEEFIGEFENINTQSKINDSAAEGIFKKIIK